MTRIFWHKIQLKITVFFITYNPLSANLLQAFLIEFPCLSQRTALTTLFVALNYLIWQVNNSFFFSKKKKSIQWFWWKLFLSLLSCVRRYFYASMTGSWLQKLLSTTHQEPSPQPPHHFPLAINHSTSHSPDFHPPPTINRGHARTSACPPCSSFTTLFWVKESLVLWQAAFGNSRPLPILHTYFVLSLPFCSFSIYIYISCLDETLGDKLTAKQLCPSSFCDLHDLHRGRLKSFPDLLTPRFTRDLGLSSPSTVGKQTVVSQGLA